MPLKMHHEILPKGEIGIWNISETEVFFRSLLDLTKDEFDFINTIKGRRKLEWLASRYLLHYMSGREKRGICLKDKFGKPYLKDSDYKISLSHSWNYAAVIASPYNVGIDIQRKVEKIKRIAHKFMSDQEFSSLDANSPIDHLHIYWGAKEAIFKAYGRKELAFKEHIQIEAFAYEPLNGKFKAALKKGEIEMNFEGKYEIMDGYFLVYVIEI